MSTAENLDQHPMRYSGAAQAIERILIRRVYEKRLDGYTLETALEIAEAMQEFNWPSLASKR